MGAKPRSVQNREAVGVLVVGGGRLAGQWCEVGRGFRRKGRGRGKGSLPVGSWFLDDL